MSGNDETERELKHALGNAKQEKVALQTLLNRASDEIEGLVESDCADQNKEQAAKLAKKFRRAASL